jgi:hypothetical protein
MSETVGSIYFMVYIFSMDVESHQITLNSSTNLKLIEHPEIRQCLIDWITNLGKQA